MGTGLPNPGPGHARGAGCRRAKFKSGNVRTPRSGSPRDWKPTLFFLVLLPVIPAIWLIATRSLGDALVNVYLPVLFLFPMYYVFNIPHVIGFNACDAALIPIIAVTIARHARQWSWQRADLWILLFAVGNGISQATNWSTGVRGFFRTVLEIFLPYLAGKLLIEEEGLRERVVRRMVWLSAIVAVISLIEFRLSKNLFVDLFAPVFSQGSPNIEQIRGGFTRAQGPYGHAIAAGMVFGSVWILALWLAYAVKFKRTDGEPRVLGVRRTVLLAWLCFLGLLIAYSRGPWLGAALAFLISRIGPAKHAARATVLVSLLCIAGGAAAYTYLNAYTSESPGGPMDQDRENAVYRRVLLDSYAPIAKEGGFFGWGLYVPIVPGQPSVDNNYLLLRLSQGLVGLWTFNLLAFESCLALLLRARRAEEKLEFSFSISLLAAIAGLLVTLGTVAIQGQATQLLYLFIGWSLANWMPEAQPEILLQEAAQLHAPRIFA